MLRCLAVIGRLATAVALLFVLGACSKGEYVGSNLSTVYHDPSCVWAEEMDKERQVWFPDAQSAGAAGYEACATCVGASELP